MLELFVARNTRSVHNTVKTCAGQASLKCYAPSIFGHCRHADAHK